MNNLKRAICAVLMSLLVACAAPRNQADLADQVIGTTYGTASWYGPKFQGRRTASGEKFDRESLTAAHLTLPFDTLVRVTNESNGKSVIVRINDRGPFTGNRIIDLSQRAAQTIGIIESGVGSVKLDVLQSATS